jgi:hypothetical protein
MEEAKAIGRSLCEKTPSSPCLLSTLLALAWGERWGNFIVSLGVSFAVGCVCTWRVVWCGAAEEEPLVQQQAKKYKQAEKEEF